MSPDDLKTRKNKGTAGDGSDCRYGAFPMGDGGAPSPWRFVVGRVWKKTGRDDTTSSTAVLLQDGWTARLRTLAVSLCEMPPL